MKKSCAKTKSEEQISLTKGLNVVASSSVTVASAATIPSLAVYSTDKKLKSKSMSQSALRVGPFASIRENEMKRKKKASLDWDDGSGGDGSADEEDGSTGRIYGSAATLAASAKNKKPVPIKEENTKRS